MDLIQQIGAIAVALWFANGWYLNIRLTAVHDKLDRALQSNAELRMQLDRIESLSREAATRDYEPSRNFDPDDIP